MVVQCPNCATKFRIADDKVTEKGVRVRCTSCKNVFQVKKSGTEAAASQATSGMTQEMQAISFGPNGELLQKPPVPPKPASAPPRPTSLPPPPKAGPTSLPPPARSGAITPPPAIRGAPSSTLSTASAPGAIGRRRPSAFARDGEAPEGAAPPAPGTRPTRARPSADDLFGMDELTGESSALPGSPLSSDPNFGKSTKPASLPPPPPREAAPPIPAHAPPPPPIHDEPAASGEPTDGSGPVKLAAIKPARRDPFEGVDLPDEGSGPITTEPDGGAAKTLPPPTPQDPALQRPVQREMVAVALTGLIGISLALAVAAAAEFANFGPAWLRDAPEEPLVATQIASGLYDASGQRPLFFIRGRIENRGASTLGPVQVTADLMGPSGAMARAETVAGTEPSPEEVHALRTPEEVDALAQKLSRAGAEKKLAPGESAPFFALIADPPADAERDELRLHVTPIESAK